jgi:hypothetical protein
MKKSSLPNNHFLIEWNPIPNTFQMLNISCTNDLETGTLIDSRNCPYFLDYVNRYNIFFLLDRIRPTIFAPNVELDFEYTNKSIIFSGSKQNYYFNDSYVSVKLENGSEYLVKYNEETQQASLDLDKLFGNNIVTVRLIRNGTSLEDMVDFIQPLIIDLGSSLFIENIFFDK